MGSPDGYFQRIPLKSINFAMSDPARYLKFKNDRGKIAAKGKYEVVYQRIPLISEALRRSDPVLDA